MDRLGVILLFHIMCWHESRLRLHLSRAQRDRITHAQRVEDHHASAYSKHGDVVGLVKRECEKYCHWFYGIHQRQQLDEREHSSASELHGLVQRKRWYWQAEFADQVAQRDADTLELEAVEDELRLLPLEHELDEHGYDV